MIFENRLQAGKILAKKVEFYKDNSVIMALPRGGVPVGFEVAKVLNLPLSIVVSRKIGAPSNMEFGVGAISEEGVCILDEDLIGILRIKKEDLQNIIRHEEEELKRRVKEYRDGVLLKDVIFGKDVILVDDGLATGITAFASIEALRKAGAKKIVFAAPICASDRSELLKNKVDFLICAFEIDQLVSVGIWYKSFTQVSDQEVKRLLHQARKFGRSKSKNYQPPHNISGVP